MNRNLIARSIAALLLGILLGTYVDYDEQKTRQMSREQYLAREGRKFDDSVANPTPRAAMVIGGVLVTGFFLIVYELIVMLLSALQRATGQPPEKSGGNLGVPFS